METELKHKDITERIIGAAFDVHSFLGSGFPEVIYQRALAYELKRRDINFQREIEQKIYYRDLPEPIGTRRADFVVDEKIIIELKAIMQLEDGHYAQILNYLKAYKMEVGLLINFGSRSLTFKRVVL
jgi:GxxExxY protein